jgi:hypothetical protein
MFFFLAIVLLALIIFNRRYLTMLGEAVAQVMAGLCLALVMGILLGNLVGDSSAGEAGYAAIFMLLLSFPSVWLMGRLGALKPRAVDDRPARRAARASPALPDLPGAASWEALAGIAPAHAARIAVARRSAARLVGAMAGPNAPADPAELANLIRKHVPGAIDSTLAGSAGQSAAARNAAIETLVETLEDIAAEAERLLSRRQAQGIPEVAIIRRRLEAMGTRSPL